MKERPLRVAVIGGGWAGRRQIEAMGELPPGHIETTWLVDRDEKHLLQTARDLGITQISSQWEMVLSDREVDAVSICTPHNLHAPMAIAAARAGKHVLVEKPMATTVQSADDMIRAAESAGVCLFVAENRVYEPVTERLKQIVDGGHIGHVAFASVVAGYRDPDPAYPGRRGWLTRPEDGGSGTWLLQAPHTIAALRRILGEVRSVYAVEHRTPTFARPDLEGTISTLLETMWGGSVWLVQTPEVDLGGANGKVTLYGDAGIAAAEHGEVTVWRSADTPERLALQEDSLSPYALELKAFVETVRGLSVGPTTGRSERQTLAVVEAALESSRLHQRIDLTARYPPPDRQPRSI